MKMLVRQTGFTLVEMAIALVIIALLIGGMLAPLSTQKEQERRTENQRLLEDVREALIGFAVVNGRLPCPDTDAPGSVTSGKENACAPLTNQFYPGRLPWVTLGLNAEFDPWGDGHLISYTVNGTYVGVFGLDAESQANLGGRTLEIHTNAGDCLSANNKVASNVPAVVRTTAKTDYTLQATPSPDEVENSNNDRCFVSRAYSTQSNAEFDDQLIWISPSILFNRMISAGTLP